METLTRTLDTLKLEPALTHGALTLFPIVRPERLPRAYLTLDEALAAKTARVSEVNAAGSVPELCFVNEGDLPVLLLDGEELVGAKQNRVLNLTILVAAGQTVVIPVSCVEAGRWSSVSTSFATSKQVMYAKARGRKSFDVSSAMRATGRPISSQADVWRDVAELSQRYRVRSPTAEMAAVFEARAKDLEDYVRAFPPVKDQAGALFAIGGRVEGLELFDHPEVLEKLLPKLVRSWALDAIHLAEKSQELPTADAARAFVDRVRRADTTAHPGVGLGEDVRFTGEGLVGGALVHRDGVVHLCVFRADDDRRRSGDDGSGERSERPISSASTRRRWWGVFRR